MAERIYKIRGIDPLLFGDGRTFSDSLGAQLAKTLPVPLPGTLASGLRTRYGRVAGWEWKADEIERAFQLRVAGPLLRRNGKVVFPQPADALIHEKEKQPRIERLVPVLQEDIGGCDLPGNLRPLRVSDDFKPLSDYPYWHWKSDSEAEMDIYSWLLSTVTGENTPIPGKLGRLATEDRIHVAIDPKSLGSQEGMLFRTRSLAFEHHPRWKPGGATGTTSEEAGVTWDVLARFHPGEDKDSQHTAKMAGPLTLGGERRMACLEDATDEEWPACPAPLATLGDVPKETPRGLRLMLATPAIFEYGWRPGWLHLDKEGFYTGTLPVCRTDPNQGSVHLKLVSAAVKRREASSGWDLKLGKAKPVRWTVPAGSVYFFEVYGNIGAFCANTWLRSLCDGDQEKRDGYGLALWGHW